MAFFVAYFIYVVSLVNILLRHIECNYLHKFVRIWKKHCKNINCKDDNGRKEVEDESEVRKEEEDRKIAEEKKKAMDLWRKRTGLHMNLYTIRDSFLQFTIPLTIRTYCHHIP